MQLKGSAAAHREHGHSGEPCCRPLPPVRDHGPAAIRLVTQMESDGYPTPRRTQITTVRGKDLRTFVTGVPGRRVHHQQGRPWSASRTSNSSAGPPGPALRGPRGPPPSAQPASFPALQRALRPGALPSKLPTHSPPAREWSPQNHTHNTHWTGVTSQAERACDGGDGAPFLMCSCKCIQNLRGAMSCRQQNKQIWGLGAPGLEAGYSSNPQSR